MGKVGCDTQSEQKGAYGLIELAEGQGGGLIAPA